MYKRTLIYLLIQEIIIFAILLFGTGISLLHYINFSFYVSLVAFLIGLIVYVMRTGFLDRVHYGFRKMSRKIRGDEENEFSDMMLSELVGIPYLDIILSSIIVFLSSIVSLFFLLRVI
ncbi:hypothetical protein MFLO_10523 [Listeria floridensis FSL S10-1187]|uniref:DUF3899 domain-containing protein n=1 Tax=Listeria floridensis FSL S10-1187 TaxID=1265817 RepID=A0ABP3AYB9_9LIST|nr:DUF3899 domain-containing protein [Listeria floridensis]EUJ30252.1 hypothetical protein MFLO_10523 [Listeria floridensis FSL S10-1187]